MGETSMEKLGIGYEALDNGFRSCEDPVELQKICDRLGPGAVKIFFWRWLHRLPSPFTAADFRAGYVDDLAEPLDVGFNHEVILSELELDRQFVDRVERPFIRTVPIATAQKVLLVDGFQYPRDR